MNTILKKGYDDLKIFDFHVHIYPEKIAQKASDNVGKFYNLKMGFDGTVKALLKLIRDNNVTKSLIHSVATNCHQVKSINDFISNTVNETPDEFVGFATLHPEMEQKEIEAEIERAEDLGLKGIKLHPDFQDFNIDDKKACEIYEVAEGRMPILFHTGDCRYNRSSPNRLAAIMKLFPKLTVIAAHFGGWSEWDKGVLYLADQPNVHIDTSSSLYAITPKRALEFIKAFTVDRVLFGTDYPMWGIKDELERFDRINLTDTEREKILWSNANRLLAAT